jgi:hypothetical protein
LTRTQGTAARTSVAASMVGIILAVAACGASTPSAAQPSGQATVAQQVEDLAFERPTSWQWSALAKPVPVDLGDVIGYLVSPGIEADSLCDADAAAACALTAQDIAAGSAAVELTAGRSLAADVWQDKPPAGAEATTVGEMPALLRESVEGEDQLLSWMIARPQTAGGWYRLDARLRGPGRDELRAALESVVASISFQPAPVALADDRVTLTQMAASALTALRREPQGRRQFECFNEQTGTRPGVVDQLPGQKRLQEPLAVACSLGAEATPWNQYRVRLRYAWPALAGRPAGEYVVTQWLAPDGTLGPIQAGGDKP